MCTQGNPSIAKKFKFHIKIKEHYNRDFMAKNLCRHQDFDPQVFNFCLKACSLPPVQEIP